jgi:hypothetical protein
MDRPPPDARFSGVLFDRPTAAPATVLGCGDTQARNSFKQRAEHSNVDDARLFGFEADADPNLTYIPLAVRFKLDKCGIKLSLDQWNQLPQRTRRDLLDAPCTNNADVARYSQMLCRLVKETVGDEPQRLPIAPSHAWENTEIPRQIADKALQLGVQVPTSEQWRGLSALQRFALLKLSRPGSDNRKLISALRELGLL